MRSQWPLLLLWVSVLLTVKVSFTQCMRPLHFEEALEVADSQLAMQREPFTATSGHGLVWRDVSHAALPMHITKLAARLTAGLHAAVASSDNPDEPLLTPSTAQHTAVGPQTAPHPQDAPLSLGHSELPLQQPAADLGNLLTSANAAAAAVMITPFAQGACSYASAMLDAIDTWVSRHQPEAKNVRATHAHSLTYEDGYIDGALSMDSAVTWADTLWQHKYDTMGISFTEGSSEMSTEILFAEEVWLHDHSEPIGRRPSHLVKAAARHASAFYAGGRDYALSIVGAIRSCKQKHHILACPHSPSSVHSRKLHQAGDDQAASDQEQAGVRAAELGAAAAAKAQQAQVQGQAAELQWDPLGFRQMPLPKHPRAGARTADQSSFKTSANEASSAAVMLKTLKRLNRDVLPHAGNNAEASATTTGLDDLPASEMLPDSSPYKPGDFYLFNDKTFRYMHHRPLLPAPLTQVQQLAEDTIAAVKRGSDSWLTMPLERRSTATN